MTYMKKYFLSALALMLGVCASAQVQTYTFDGLVEDDCNTTLDGNELSWGTYVMDGKDCGSISVTAGAALRLEIIDTPIAFTYSNSKAKDNVVKCAAEYIQFDSKNFVMEIANVPASATIVLNVSAKGDADAKFNNPGSITTNIATYSSNAGAVTKAASVAEFSNVTCVRTDDGTKTVKIKETNGGYRLRSVSIIPAGSTPIKSINADSLPAGKSVKTIEDGKVIIIRDGVKYNMNGSIIK